MATINISNGLIHSTGAYCLSAGSSDSYVMIHDNYVCVPTLCTGSTANFNNIVVSGDLTVHGSCTILNTTVCTTSAMSITNQGTGPALVVNQTGSQPVVSLLDDGNSVFYIEDGGNVGIGTDGPTQKLDVRGGSGAGTLTHAIFTGTSNRGLEIRTRSDTSGGQNSGTAEINSADSEGTGGDLAFSSNGNVRMFIEGAGNVGIGTTSPLANLHIYGSDEQSLFIGSSNANRALFVLDGASNGDGAGGDYAYLAHNADGSFDIKNLQNNSINFATGSSSTTRMSITSGGSVGIGTTDPQRLVTLYKASTPVLQLVDSTTGTGASDGFLLLHSGLNTTIENSEAGYMAFRTTANEKMRIDASGNVGIGTTDPAAKLDVCGTDTVFSVNGTNGTIFNVTDDLSDSLMSVNTIAGLPVFEVFADNTIIGGRYNQNDFYLQGSTGNIGLGTSSPITKLNIKGDQSANGQLYIEPKNDEEYAGLVIKTTRGADRAYGIYAGGTGTDDLNFRFRDASACADRMVIDSSGNVGIGTVCPAATLDVEGDTRVDGNLWIGGVSPLSANSSINSSSTCLIFKNNTIELGRMQRVGTTAGRIPMKQYSTVCTAAQYPAFTFVGDENTGMYLYGADTLGFSTGGAPRMLINNGGNVGIGTTSPTLGKLQVAGRGYFGPVGTGDATTKTLMDTYSVLKLKPHDSNSTNMTFAQVNNGNGIGIQVTNGDQTADWDIALNPYGGNVGIGTASPDAKLHVFSSSDPTIKIGGGVSDGTTGGTAKLHWAANNGTVGNGFFATYYKDATNDRLTFIDGGAVNVLTLENGGNVGIGTTDPVGKLHVCSSNNVNIAILDVGSYATYKFTANSTSKYTTLFNMDNTGLDIGHDSSVRSLNLKTANADRVTILGNGNVGIGTTDPSYKLDVSGNARVTTDLFVNDQLAVKTTTLATSNNFHVSSGTTGSASKSSIAVVSVADNSTFYNGVAALHVINSGNRGTKCNSNGSDLLRLEFSDSIHTIFDKNGNVGIGTDSPSYPLDVVGYVNSSIGYRAGNYTILNETGNETSFGNTAYYGVSFKTNNLTRMKITNAGNVGIGTTDPGSCYLQVQGESKIVGKLHVTGSINLCNSNLCNAENITINDPGAGEGLSWNSTTGGWMIDVSPLNRSNADGNLNFYNSSSNNIALWRPQLWVYDASNYATGTANSDGSLTITSTNSGDTIFSVDGTNGTLFSVVDDLSDSLMSVNDAAGLPVFEVFADNTICAGRYSCSDFYLDGSSGNIGIGTTNPQAKLEVSDEALIDGLTVGRGGGSVSTNTAVGTLALENNTTGTCNTAVGMNSLCSNTTGSCNTAVGTWTLYCNTTGTDNIAVGGYSLFLNTTGSCNTAVGMYSLCSNTTGNYNTAHGYRSLCSNTTGNCNTAVGMNSLLLNTTGYSNTAHGYEALRYNTTGYQNTAVGYKAIMQSVQGIKNTATGTCTLYSNTTGNQNVAYGVEALHKNTAASYNTAVGHSSMFWNTTGSSNTAYGYGTLYCNTTGCYNTAVGLQPLRNNTTGSCNTASGYRALFCNTTGCKNTASGMYSLFLNTAGSCNTAHGMYSLYCNTTGAQNTASGYRALFCNTTGSYNTAVGANSLCRNTTGAYNTAVGYGSLYFNTTGNSNVALGMNSLFSNTSGCQNTAVGIGSLEDNTTGCDNTATGTSSLSLNTAGIRNTAYGMYSLKSNTTGINNTAHGSMSLRYNTTGTKNTAVGTNSAYCNTIGYQNTAVGYQALRCNTTGYNNTAVGYDAGCNITTQCSIIAIGSGACTSLIDRHTVWGSIYNNVCNCVYTSWSNVSDCRDKTDIAPLNSCYGVSFIKKLSPVSYKWDNRQTYVEKCNYNYGQKDGSLKSEKCHYGFLAQDIKTSLEELNITFDGLGHDPDKDAYRLTYEELIAPLVKAVQELTERVEILEKDNTSLKDRIYELENK